MIRILIAEDESRLAAFLEKGFQKNGFSTLVASDGEEAIQITLEQEFGLLLLDLGLPVKDGFSVLKELRDRKEQFPIIVITALNDDYIRATALALGANDYMTKPFSFGELLKRVQSQIAKK